MFIFIIYHHYAHKGCDKSVYINVIYKKNKKRYCFFKKMCYYKPMNENVTGKVTDNGTGNSLHKRFSWYIVFVL